MWQPDRGSCGERLARGASALGKRIARAWPEGVEVIDPLEAQLEAAERAIARVGCPRWELYVEEVRSVSAEAQDGAIEALERSIERSVAIRVLDGGVGFAALAEPDADAIEGAVRAAQAEARRARPSALVDFAGPSEASPAPEPQTDFFDHRASGAVRPLLVDRARGLEAAALAQPGVVRVRPASMSEHAARWRMRTSAGLDVGEHSSRAYAGLCVIAENDDDSSMAFESASASCLEALDLSRIVARSALRAVRMLGASPVATARLPVVWPPAAVLELVELLAAALCADSVERGASFLAGRLGERVFGQALTLEDRPRDADLDGAVLRDGEGLVTASRGMVVDGVVRAFAHDRSTAARAGTVSSAQATRSGRGRPSPQPHALSVAAGSRSLEAILLEAEGGIWVDEVLGAHTMNEITSELSLGIRGFRIRGGAWAEPIDGATVAGTLPGLLSAALVASAETEVSGGARAPTWLIPDVQVASGP